jgi:hypothetical protein
MQQVGVADVGACFSVLRTGIQQSETRASTRISAVSGENAACERCCMFTPCVSRDYGWSGVSGVHVVSARIPVAS